MTNRTLAVSLCAAGLLAACTAISQQKAQQEAGADNLEFHNLRVLPPNITHDELIATMRGFARGLGVRCNHCHVANPPGSKEEFDFASDAKPEKRAARLMLRMVRSINHQYVSKVNEDGQTVGCVTCHRGQPVPDITLAQIPERARRPEGQAPAPQPKPEPQPPM